MQRRWWGLAVLVAVITWWAWSEPEPDAPIAEVATPSPEPFEPPAPLEAPPVLSEPDAAVEAPDAGLRETPVREPTPAEVEAYIARWRKALEPLLKYGVRQKPAWLLAGADAGVTKEPCEPEREFVIGNREAPFEVLVAIDTSGSMRGPGLEQVATFLGAFEYELVSNARDARLTVLAGAAPLQLSSDAGFTRATVGSNDGLEIIASTARAPPSWLQTFRPGVEVRVVLATDDGPSRRMTLARAQASLADVFPERPFSFHVVGGFPGMRVLDERDPLSTGHCSRSGGLFGMDDGKVYQQLALATGGLRASLCDDASLKRLAQRLATPPGAPRRCSVEADEDARVLSVTGFTARGDAVYLSEERSEAQCAGLRRSFVKQWRGVTLCGETCAEFASLGVERLRVEQKCPPVSGTGTR